MLNGSSLRIEESKYIFSLLHLLESYLDEIFKQVEKKDGAGGNFGALFSCQRHNHVPVLHIRRARYVSHHYHLISLLSPVKVH